MPQDVEANGADTSDVMSENENEYDDVERLTKDDDDDKMADQHSTPETGAEGSGEVKKKYDPKDPHRPRRKKARRACYACQRAHLTCGDERPCQRCIKRGLADACQDGVRKKAKYLHDAPPEALRPVLGPTFNTSVQPKANGRHPSNATSESSSYYPPSSSTQSYPIFTGGQPQVSLPDGMQFSASQATPISPSFQQQQNTPRAQQMANLQVPTPTNEMGFQPALFDPSNPAIFNFDLEGLNFGSHYGAMEFGMLGHMSSGAAETPPRDPSISQAPSADTGFGGAIYPNGMGQFGPIYENNMMESFLGNDQSNGAYAQGNLQHGLPHAYAIAAAGPTPTSLASPGTDNTASPQATNLPFESSPTAGNFTSQGQPQPHPPARHKHKSSANASGPKFGPQSILGKRNRDPSAIYEMVKEPYQYLTGFHNLIAFVKRRFSSTKTLRIAKSLASIRPSFIACTRNLNRQDLIFMEKCLQRTLFEYEDFMGHCSAPTIVCRRTGEVAAVNKEFIALTGWSKDILLGKEPNLNVNTGDSSAGSVSDGNSNRGGLTTPQLKAMEPIVSMDGKPQPVFIAELMDDNSVIQFYEDFAQLAFGDSRGHVTRKCRLLKYRTKEAGDLSSTSESPAQPPKDPRNSILSNRVTRIDGEHGISKLEKDGKMDCTYCWTIKRDVFDIPMLIVINFLPCYYRNQDQLAV
ncbi:hypothetical protein BX600DRAFT_462130 [Xylariales sp. PMI_506]|nr:hypothetical protein BX600DRAFT_462130 [Xylariales sp. PMI_506]